MPRIDSFSAMVRSGLKASATHAGGMDDQVEEVEDAPAPEEAGSKAGIILRWDFNFTDVPEVLRGSGTVRRWLRGNCQG